MSMNNGENTTQGDDDLAANLTAHALDQLHGDDLATLKTHLAQQSTDELDRDLHQTRSLADALTFARNSDPLPTPSPDLRNRIEQHFAEPPTKTPATKPTKSQPRPRRLAIAGWAIAASLLLALLLLPASQSYRESARRMQSSNLAKQIVAEDAYDRVQVETELARERTQVHLIEDGERPSLDQSSRSVTQFHSLLADVEKLNAPAIEAEPMAVSPAEAKVTQRSKESLADDAPSAPGNPPVPYFRANGLNSEPPTARGSAAAGPPPPAAKGGYGGVGYDGAGMRPGAARAPVARAKAPATGMAGMAGEPYQGQTPPPGDSRNGVIGFNGRNLSRGDQQHLAEQLATVKDRYGGQVAEIERRAAVLEQEKLRTLYKEQLTLGYSVPNPGEQYDPITENTFLSPLQNPLSTFSIDVDTASYANVRRFLTSSRLPPPNSVRIEELVNYFRYDYPQPKGNDPFSVNMEVAECPWRENHLLLRVGLKGKDVHRTERPQSNLVFLLDVSGSMADQNKLPLLKTAMQMLVRELGENDRVSIVTYAGEAGLRLPPTRGHEQTKIHAAIESLSAGGSTNGSAGINLAYEQSAAYFIPGGTNRVILCTDGDLNVGITNDDALVQLIKQKATGGTFLTVLGFGEGNLKDAKMEKLADNGNGLYAYVDSVREARKVLVEQLTGSTITIAKDVKIQIEFNPQQIAAYRLLGYENRLLAAQDFNNDKKDAGEIGAGHTVTALYELVPTGLKTETTQRAPTIDPLKYQPSEASGRREPPGNSPIPDGPKSPELLTLKLRYKRPDADTSQLLEYPLADRGASFNSASPDFQFAASVASFGMILRSSQYRASSTLPAVAQTASAALGADPSGYRAEFVDLVHKAQSMSGR